MYDYLIVGAGIVGLATARSLRTRHPEARIAILDKEAVVARHQSSHNSGVIHSGVYYKPGSLKSQICRAGYAALLEFCRSEAIAHEICGKVIVATDAAEEPRLREIMSRGVANGLTDLKLLDRTGLRSREPHCAGTMALHVPQAGIVDYAEVSRRIARRLLEAGVELLLGQQVRGIQRIREGFEVATPTERYHTRVLVNCAGLHSDAVARLTGARVDARVVPFRGEYYTLRPGSWRLVRNLIYPVPDPNFPFLGVHFTRALDGEVEAGPSAVLALKREGYRRRDLSVAELGATLAYGGFQRLAAKHWRMGAYEQYRSFSRDAFVRDMRKLIPSITSADVIRGRTGVRAQAVRADGSLVDDFAIGEAEGVVNVVNAPSPAATACFAIGEYIAERVAVRV